MARVAGRVGGRRLDPQQETRVDEQRRHERAQLRLERRFHARVADTRSANADGLARGRRERVGLALRKRPAEQFLADRRRHAAQPEDVGPLAGDAARAQLELGVGGRPQRTLDGHAADAEVAVAALGIGRIGIPEVVGEPRDHRVRAAGKLDLAHHQLRRRGGGGHRDAREGKPARGGHQARVLVAGELPRGLERDAVAARVRRLEARRKRARGREPRDAVVGPALPLALELLRRDHAALRPRLGRHALLGDPLGGVEVLLDQERRQRERRRRGVEPFADLVTRQERGHLVGRNAEHVAHRARVLRPVEPPHGGHLARERRHHRVDRGHRGAVRGVVRPLGLVGGRHVALRQALPQCAQHRLVASPGLEHRREFEATFRPRTLVARHAVQLEQRPQLRRHRDLRSLRRRRRRSGRRRRQRRRNVGRHRR